MSFSGGPRQSGYSPEMENRSMTTAEATRDELGAVAAATQAGDESAFSVLTERYRRELQVHCYRLLGSFEDSEDLTQETFLRAWRKRASFRGQASFRAWLYSIATNACLDALRRRPRRPVAADESAGTEERSYEVPWLQPYPDRLLEGIPAPDAEPDVAVVSKETIELAFMVAIQQLTPNQRAVLIMRDVLGWPAKDTASVLDTSVASVNSALQRARAGLKEYLPQRRLEWAADPEPSPEERALLQRYLDATEQADPDAFIEMMREDATFAMPPEPCVYVGREKIIGAWREGGAFDADRFGHMRGVLTRANMQPAVACYVKHPGESEYRPFAIDVLRIEDGRIAEITGFGLPEFRAFGLPPTL
jgi:RNA polymerase sigma-70 factor, ECF subfamily